MMPPDTVSLEFIAGQQMLLLEEVKAARAENREVRRTFTLISEHFGRQERRIAELRDDIDTMLKLEIGGSIANFETRIETYIDARINAIEGRLDSLEGRMDRIEARLDSLEGRMDRIEARLDSLEGRMDGLEGRMDRLEAGLGDLALGQAQLNTKLDTILAAVLTA